MKTMPSRCHDPMRFFPCRRGKAAASVLVLAATIGGFANAAHAARIAIAPLETSGMDDALAANFRDALKEAFSRAPHEIVPPASASHQVRGSVRREKALYEFELRITELATGKIVAEKRGECVPCTQVEAVQKFRVAVQTLQLKLSSLGPTSANASAATAPGPPSASANAPTDQSRRGTARKDASLPAGSASSTIEGPTQSAPAESPSVSSGRSRSPVEPPSSPATAVPGASLGAKPLVVVVSSPGPHRFTRWYRALIATAFVPGLALGATGIVFGCNHGFPSGGSDCHTSSRVLGIGIGLTAVGHVLVVTDVVNALGATPDNPRGYRALAWSSIAAGLALGAGGYYLVNDHGYGTTGYKVLGFADLPLAAMSVVIGVGTLIAGPTSPAVAPVIGAGTFGVQGRF